MNIITVTGTEVVCLVFLNTVVMNGAPERHRTTLMFNVQ